jgi:hypothetical protein
MPQRPKYSASICDADSKPRGERMQLRIILSNYLTIFQAITTERFQQNL